MSADINSDHETYDSLENEVENKPTGFLLEVLPGPLYKLLFGSKPPQPDIVASRRAQASENYQRAINEPVVQSLFSSDSTEISCSEDLSLDEIGFDHFSHDISSFEIADATDDDLQTYLRALETEFDHAEGLHSEIKSIIEGDDWKYLRASEQEQLEIAQQALKTYRRKLSNKQDQLQTAWLTRKIDHWKGRVEMLETRMDPYFSYEKYEINNSLHKSIEEIQRELVTAERNFGTTLLSGEQVAELEQIKQRVGELSDYLKNYQQDYIDHQFSEGVDELKDEIMDIQHALTPAKAQGQPIDSEVELRDKITKIRNKIVDLRGYPFGDSTLDSLQSRTESIEAYIDSKIIFDYHISLIESEISSLRQVASPYLNHEEYLTQADRSQAEKILKTITPAIETVNREVNLDRLSSPDQERFAEAIETVREIEECFEGYNDDFIRRARKRHEERQFLKTVMHINNELRNLQRALTPAKSQGHRINQDQKIELRDQIATVRNRLSDLRRYSFGDSTVDSLESRTKSIEAYIDTKVVFDSHIEPLESRVSSLQQAACTYLNYDEYLTRVDRSRLEEMFEAASSVIQTVRNEVDLDQLGSPDQERFVSAINTISEISEHLAGYNQAFISRERDRYEYLFSDIGPNNLDLTLEQQRAVIRNGIYNQVIAAAGTGKTLTLTTRVAYLIETQGIDPSNILVVTYTNEAANEMNGRLQDQFGITDVAVKTVHAFGYQLIQESQDRFIESIDPNEIQNFIDQQIREARNDESSTFLSHYYEFLVHFDDVYHDETDFETKKAYVEARLNQTYVTLKGTEVKSRAEKLIADFLFTHQVEYRYEDRATWADSASDKAGYTPDFYLPNHDTYIEHWGIDESGSVAPWFSQTSRDYRDKIRWARQQFTGTEHTLIETHEFEHEANQLKQVLRHRLTQHGIDLDQMEFEQLVDSAFKYDQREGWIKSRFKSFIENAKRFELKPSDINRQLSEENPRQYHFGQCGIYLLKQYVLYLTQNRLIDFQDMIHDAVESIQQNPEPYKQRYEHLLVDEFQDIGKGTLDLIQELTGEDAAKLFAVGDDWQSIFSFQGAVIDYFTEFATYFGEPVRTDLTTNFRSPPSVVEAGNHLIQNNSNQLEKTVYSPSDQQITPQVHILRGYRFHDYLQRVRRYAVKLVQEYIVAGADPGEIMILCRYDGAVPYLREIKDGLESQQIPYVGKSDQYRGPSRSVENGVSVYSLYQAKGREADHVILVHAAEGPYGFPSDRREDELLNPVKPLDVGGLEEERRAFYVAVTRTEHTLDFLTRGEKKSQFLKEIEEFTETIDAGQVEPLEDVGEHMSITVKIRQLLDPWTKQHQRAIVADQYGGSARFVSWTNADPPTFEEDEWYELSGLKVSRFKNEKELIWTTDSTVQHLPTAPSITELAQHNTDTSELSVTNTKVSVPDTPERFEKEVESYLNITTASSKRAPIESVNKSIDMWNEELLDSVTNHPLFLEVLSTLADLGGTASTAQIAENIGIDRTGAFDRLRTLEAESKVNRTSNGKTELWEINISDMLGDEEKLSINNTIESSLTKPAEPITKINNQRTEQSLDSVTNHSLFQEVLSTLVDLGGTASTAQIAENIDIDQIGAFDRLRTLESENKVTHISNSETDMWKIVE